MYACKVREGPRWSCSPAGVSRTAIARLGDLELTPELMKSCDRTLNAKDILTDTIMVEAPKASFTGS